MSKSRKLPALLVALVALPLLTSGAGAEQPASKRSGLGRLAHPDEIRAWDIDVRPDGQGLPAGSGSVRDGEALFQERCATCHGDFGEGTGRFPVLAGGRGSLDKESPIKTVGSFWPYAATLYDYVRRAKPYGNARSLSDDEVYAVAAYVLSLNDVVKDDFVFSRETLLTISMPNAAGFRDDDRMASEKHFWARSPCMKTCGKGPARIVGRAGAIDVTPDAKDRPRGE